jgi:hypothetical protein
VRQQARHDEPETAKAILKALVRRVEVANDCVKIDICRRDLVEALPAPSIDLTARDNLDGTGKAQARRPRNENAGR